MVSSNGFPPRFNLVKDLTKPKCGLTLELRVPWWKIEPQLLENVIMLHKSFLPCPIFIHTKKNALYSYIHTASIFFHASLPNISSTRLFILFSFRGASSLGKKRKRKINLVAFSLSTRFNSPICFSARSNLPNRAVCLFLPLYPRYDSQTHRTRTSFADFS